MMTKSEFVYFLHIQHLGAPSEVWVTCPKLTTGLISHMRALSVAFKDDLWKDIEWKEVFNKNLFKIWKPEQDITKDVFSLK